MGEVSLVADQQTRCLLVLSEHFMPHLDVKEGVCTRDIVHKDCAVGVFKIGRDQAPITLLSSSVPHLHTVCLATSNHILDVEIDADGRLNGAGVTL